ncbi:unnamed protein product [Lactuca saligna]|uniref:Uncharacterized protein n=1 Tax=Lactuca saligna TaxID=75948 RepID=A0AA35VMP5_LACSI|nr:unnamed protein product [Lactuca saligna]
MVMVTTASHVGWFLAVHSSNLLRRGVGLARLGFSGGEEEGRRLLRISHGGWRSFLQFRFPEKSLSKSTSDHSKPIEEEELNSSDHSDDSLATTQRKRDWRVAKFADEIWKEQGFNTSFDETLINSWVNPTSRLLDVDYIPHLNYVQPTSDGYWDIPISPNSKYFLVFKPLDLNIPDERRLPMEFEHLNLFHAKQGSKFENICSNDRPNGVKNYKARKFMKKIHPVLSNKFNFPPFEPVPDYTEGFQDMSLGATSYPKLGIVYKKAIDGPKFFIPVSIIHRLTKKQLDVTLASVQRSKHTTDVVKFEISSRLIATIKKSGIEDCVSVCW